MLIYLLDGNNLYHALESLEDAAEPRLGLINYIKQNHLTGSRVNQVVIIFDGHESADISLEREFNVICSGARSADDVLKEQIQKYKHKRQLVVVSDDHQVIDYARALGTQVLRNKEFLNKKHHQAEDSPKYGDKFLSSESIDQINKELTEVWVKKKK